MSNARGIASLGLVDLVGGQASSLSFEKAALNGNLKLGGFDRPEACPTHIWAIKSTTRLQEE